MERQRQDSLEATSKNQIPAGTRCEYVHRPSGATPYRCREDAVRMVMIATNPNNLGVSTVGDLAYAVPMCAACAAWHESKSGAR